MSKTVSVEKSFYRKGGLAKFTRIYPSSFEIYQLLYALSEDDAKTEVKLETLVELSGYSLAKVVRILRSLEEAKIIHRTHEKQGVTKCYILSN